MRGITVKLINRVEVGLDAINNPIYEYTSEYVSNVLVAPGNPDDIVTDSDLEGKRVVYTLGIPKGDEHVWTDCKVEFFGKTFKSFGDVVKGIESLVPTAWHKKVMVELYE